ncbi:MAG TPA: protein kinase [Polyangiaceae bacterium]
MGRRATTIENAKTVASLPLCAGTVGEDVIPKVDGYEIEAELGRGGMGVVYKAVQIKLGRPVALKMILAQHAQGEERERFASEGEAVARFQHPNIVQIYEVGEAEGRPYFSLEYVEGGSLEDKFGGKPMAWKPAAELLVILSHAMQAAHARGIVHRDLKPANILLSKDGTPKVTDFGIAKRLDAIKQTQTGKILGTPCYMAPEQALGRSDQVGPATDIYALGAILYDALTGRPPFEADNTLDTLMQAVVREPIPPRELQPKIPRDLDVICLKCLEKKPEKRYASAQELADDLERLLRNEPILARPIGTLERCERWARRHPAWAMLMGVSGLALLGLAATGAWFTHELQQELRATEAARQDATAAQVELRQRLVRSTADAINSDLLQLAGVPRVIAAALAGRSDWTEAQLTGWLRAELDAEPHVFGMAVAFEPKQFHERVDDFCLYVFRGKSGIQVKQLLPPEYAPIYRQWDWYSRATKRGTWSEPYVDDGGGEIPMVTFSMPFERRGRKAGVVTVDLSLEYFRALDRSMRHSNVAGDSYAFVLTKAGTIVNHPNPKFEFPAPGSSYPKQNPSPVWSVILSGEQGRAHGIDLATNQPAELLFAPVKAAQWSTVAVIPD